MKKFLISAVAVLILASISGPSAQALYYRRAATTTADQMRDKMQDREGERKMQKPTSSAEQVLQIRKDRVRQFWSNMAGKIEKAVERLTQMSDRIESRLNKFEQEKGKDVSKARAKLAEGRRHIQLAKDSWTEAKARYEELINSANPRPMFERARAKVKETISHLKEAHAALVDAVVALKGASGKTPHATSSASSATTSTSSNQ